MAVNTGRGNTSVKTTLFASPEGISMVNWNCTISPGLTVLEPMVFLLISISSIVTVALEPSKQPCAPLASLSPYVAVTSLLIVSRVSIGWPLS